MKRQLLAAASMVVLTLAQNTPALSADPTTTDKNTATTATTAPATTITAATVGTVYSLGQINVTAKSPDGGLVGGAVLGEEDIARFNRDRLDRALDTVPGLNIDTTRGPRNERMVNVRGFSRFQVPLYLDGVQLFLPADNRIDLGRFLTSDLSEVQIAKGYASVLDGPGGMGGAINLVTRKPAKGFEGELRTGMSLDQTGARSGFITSGSAGTRQEKFYVQGSASMLDQGFFRLSDNYTATANENGNRRDHSGSRDWRVNLKAGFTPNDTDEYSINYLKQNGRKGAPLHTTDPSSSSTIKYWDWPQWQIQNVSLASHTKLGEKSYVDTRFFHTNFDNTLESYDDKTLTTQKTAKAFSSIYNDKAYGGKIEVGTDLIPYNTLKAAFHVRHDEHQEYQWLYSPSRWREPTQTSDENVYSLALEDTVHLSPTVDWVLGGSRDWRVLDKAQDWNGTQTGSFVNYQTTNSAAWNGQTALVWHYSKTGKTYASISHRTRFPTLFERFSSRFGGATSNPNLQPETATNYEIGASEMFFGNTRVEGAVFIADVRDEIQSVNIIYSGSSVTQNQNVGSGIDRGFELSFQTRLDDRLEFGAHYTLLVRSLEATNVSLIKPTGSPTHKAFAYVDYQPIEKLHIVPTVEVESDRWTSNSGQTEYFRTGSHVIANLKASYEVKPGFEIEALARNLTDANYQLIDGYPEEGRSYFIGARYKF